MAKADIKVTGKSIRACPLEIRSHEGKEKDSEFIPM
jgi:hypothetical protein